MTASSGWPKTGRDTGIVSAPLSYDVFLATNKAACAALRLGLLVSESSIQLIERLGMKQSPPIPGNIAAFSKEVLGFSARDVCGGRGVRDRMLRIIADVGSRGTLEVGTNRATSNKQRGQDRNQRQNATACKPAVTRSNRILLNSLMRFSGHMPPPCPLKSLHNDSTSPIFKHPCQQGEGPKKLS